MIKEAYTKIEGQTDRRYENTHLLYDASVRKVSLG